MYGTYTNSKTRSGWVITRSKPALTTLGRTKVEYTEDMKAEITGVSAVVTCLLYVDSRSWVTHGVIQQVLQTSEAT